jgi:hypothetical protein
VLKSTAAPTPEFETSPSSYLKKFLVDKHVGPFEI